MRFDDNFSYLQNDSLKTVWKEKIKFMPLGNQFKLSLGGEWREQYQSYENLNFGEVPAAFTTDSPHQIMHRIMFHANITWNEKLRIFGQLNSTIRFLNPNLINSQVDENQLSMHQLFAEVKLAPSIWFRIGKQEMSLGLERFIATREGPNTRAAFLGGLLKYAKSNHRLDAFLTNPIKMNTGVFDDVRSSEVLGGLYFQRAFKPSKANVDLYYLYLYSDLREYLFKKGLENRHTIGFRFYSALQTINYDVELAHQSGTFDQLKIDAFMGVWDFNIRTMKDFYAGFSGNYVPGDQSTSDNELNTFNTLFARPPFGQTITLNITNTINFSPYIRYLNSNKYTITLRGSFINRQSISDGIYTPNMSALRPVVGKKIISSEFNVGEIFAIDANYFPQKNWSFQTEFGYCIAGNYMKDSGIGNNVLYFALKSAFKF